MKRYLFTLVLISITFSASAQVDYEEIKDQYQRVCGLPDSATVIHNQILLDSIIQLEITNGKEQLLRDIGMVYYYRYLIWNDTKDAQFFLKYNLQNWTECMNMLSLNAVGHAYKMLGDCEKAFAYTEQYILVMKEDGLEKDIDYKQMYLRYKYCK